MLADKVCKDDRLPENVCSECLYKLEMFYEFYNASSRSNDKLQKYLSTVTAGETSQSTEPPLINIQDEDEEIMNKPETFVNDFAMSSNEVPHDVNLNEFATSASEGLLLVEEDKSDGGNEQSSSYPAVINSVSGVPEDERIVSCRQCALQFSSRTELSVHSCNSITCCYCDKVFSNVKELAAHKRGHTSFLSYSCRQCGIDLHTSDALKSHINSGSCYMVLSAVSNDHMYSSAMTVSKKTVKAVTPYSCNVCSKSFNLARSMAKHIKSKDHRHHLAQERWKISKSKHRIWGTKYNSRDIHTVPPEKRKYAGNHDGESLISEESKKNEVTSQTVEKPKRKRRATYLDNSWVLGVRKRKLHPAQTEDFSV
ncbi:zinc finger protein 782 isoform X2 [Anabrus simplex]|uniref:zinc finger protein 782 isoform X2 n=1 Tax=Anabrus simplex TaxID=316456 RepID=UPI0035A3CEC0